MVLPPTPPSPPRPTTGPAPASPRPPIQVRMPQFSDDAKATVNISELRATVGQLVRPNQILLVVESDKGVQEITPQEVEINRPVRVTEIHVSQGTPVVSDQLLFTLEELTDDEMAAAGIALPARPQQAPVRPPPPPPPPPRNERAEAPAPPIVPRVFEPLGTTPPAGQPNLSRDEALARMFDGLSALLRGGTTSGAPASLDHLIPYLARGAAQPLAICGPHHEIPLDPFTLAMAAAMVTSATQIPQAHEQYDCDVTLMEAHRRAINAGRGKGQGITLLAYVIRAVAETLKDHPQLRSAIDPAGDRLLVRDYYDIGFAVDGAKERLYVPVVRQADKRNILEISDEMRRLAAAAREGKLNLKDMGKATISISNMGSLGAESVIPLVNPPEAAILGMGRVEENCVRLTPQGMTPWHRLPLIISFDHRFVTGAQAGRFMRDLKKRLESLDWLTEEVLGVQFDPHGIRPPTPIGLSPSVRQRLREQATRTSELVGAATVAVPAGPNDRTEAARAGGIGPITTLNLNTIPAAQEVPYPGGERAVVLARKLADILRWNVMATVASANKKVEALGGHISTLASNADIMVSLLLFFMQRGQDEQGRLVGRDDDLWGQGHDWPGLLAVLNLLGLLSDEDLDRFRQQMGHRDAEGRIVIDLEEGRGTDSYNHAITRSGRRLARNRSVVMGSGGLQSIHTARVGRYLEAHGLVKGASENRCWAILGDASMREPEHQADLDIAARDNLKVRHFVNVNLQGLDGVADGDGNGNLFHKLEARYRAAGWKVIKVMFDSRWDPILERDTEGLIAQRISKMADGNLLFMQGQPGSFIRENFFGKKGTGKFEDQEPNPELLKLVEGISDEELKQLGWGGHDPVKIFSAMSEADATDGPAVVLFRTVKGKSMGPLEASLQTHGEKKIPPKTLLAIRDSLGAPFTDAELVTLEGEDQVPHYPLWKPGVGGEKGDYGAAEVVDYLRERRMALGGPVPHRTVIEPAPIHFSAADLQDIFGPMEGRTDGQRMSTTVALDFADRLMQHEVFGRFFVPVLADEADTFGWSAQVLRHGVFSLHPQGYTSPRPSMGKARYKEGPDGRVFQVGISEAAGMAVFTALGTVYAKYGLPMIPIFTCYSKFGLPHVGSWFWGAGDVRARGIFLAATNGKTTLLEGPEHADGESSLQAHMNPHMRTYDPVFPFDMAVIFRHAIATLYGEGDRSLSDVLFNIMMYNQMFPILPRPEGVTDADILGGLYRFTDADPALAGRPQIQLIGSGPLFFEALRAKQILEERFRIGAPVWNATSPSEVQRAAERAAHHNLYHPGEPEQETRVTRLFREVQGPIVVSTDHHTAWGGLLNDALPRKAVVLGPNGYGPCDDRAILRRGFGTDAESMVLAGLSQLLRSGTPGVRLDDFSSFLADHTIDPERLRPMDIL